MSTIGAQASQSNLLTQPPSSNRWLGQLCRLDYFSAAGGFMENSAWDIVRARRRHSAFLQPLDKPYRWFPLPISGA